MYGKIFKSIYYGSLADVPPAREMMACLCVHADKEGFVDMTAKSIGMILRMSEKVARGAFDTLAAADPASASEAEEGRRILSRGFEVRGIQIVNYEAYRKLQTEEDKKGYMKRYYQEVLKPKRRNESTDVNFRQPASTNVREESGETEAEAGESEVKTDKEF